MEVIVEQVLGLHKQGSPDHCSSLGLVAYISKKIKATAVTQNANQNKTTGFFCDTTMENPAEIKLASLCNISPEFGLTDDLGIMWKENNVHFLICLVM